MNALVHDGRRAALANLPAPVPAAGEALLRPRRVAISAFDAAMLDAPAGKEAREALVLGHRFVARVQSLSSDADASVRSRWVDTRAVASPVVPCATCELCRGGLWHHCATRVVMGVCGRGGALAESMVAPVRSLTEVPATVTDDQAALAVPVAAAIHAAQLARVEGKHFVTVLGDSVEALLAAQVMARLNASVRLLGVHTAHFGLCERWGVKHRHQDEVGRRRDQDLIIDATGTSASLALALRLVRPRGKVVALAQPAAPMSGDRAILDPDSLALLVSGEAQLLGARGGSLADAMALLARGEIDVVPLITARKKLDDAVSALRLAREPDQLCVMIEL